METLFYNIKQQNDPSTLNYLNYASLIKIILHKYFYSNNDYLLKIISCIRRECDVTEVVYNHNNRTFVIKVPKGKMTKIQKEIQRNNTNGLNSTINEYFYNTISRAFHDFFLYIREDFINSIDLMPDVEIEDAQQVIEAFYALVQNPYLVMHMIQIVSIIESDNCIVINV